MISAISQKVASPSKILFMSFLSICFAVLIGLSALIKIPIPFTPIPITLQTFTLLLGAGILNRWYSLQMVAWYIILGLLGTPFFVNGGGLQVITGPTAGYLLGFIIASAIIGFSKKNAYTFTIATIALYVPGVLWLKIITSASLKEVMIMGVVPFILFDLIKAMTAYSSVTAIKHFLSKKD